MIWGVGLLVADPVVYRRRPADSLITDVDIRTMGSGITRLLIQRRSPTRRSLWEGLNYWARGKWIYTVPLLEEIKVFEMPPLGVRGLSDIRVVRVVLVPPVVRVEVSRFPYRDTPP